MDKRWKQTTMTMMALSLIASPIFTINSNAESTDYYSYDDNLYDQQLQKGTEAVNKAIKTKDEKDIKNAIDIVFNIPEPNGYRIDDKRNLLYKLIDLVNEMDSKNKLVNYGLYFVEASIHRAKTTLIKSDYELAYGLVHSLPDGKTKTNYQNQLKKIKQAIEKETLETIKNTNQLPIVFDWSYLPESSFTKYVDVNTGNYLPGYPLKSSKNKSNDANPLAKDTFKEKTVYKTEGSKCYKITTKTNLKTNKSVTTKKVVTGEDATYCDILPVASDSYDFSKVQPAPVGSGDNINGGIDGTISYFTKTSAMKNGSASIKQTIRYTLDRTDKNPTYYDTNIEVSTNGTITYKQVKDVFYQLAIKSGGKMVEDKDRFLILLENKIIVMQDTGENIPISIFDTLLKGFKAEVKVMKEETSKS